MTKDVLVTVTGRQFDVADEPIELVTTGTYYEKNGKHYVLYEEQPDENEPIIKNRVKFFDGYFQMVKNGAVSSELTFIQDKQSESLYETGAMAVQMHVITKKLVISNTKDLINAVVRYDLHINGEYISECEVDFKVQPR
ncbi:MAG: DUF1934 domain-containing protein [Lachnospiraceae bacterium]|jgi:uncharacterized beta-barrel protein YwiB (DUF1934 family)|nr:DUF1934 domain-containing protein [Lachnospiraceae bacterium]